VVLFLGLWGWVVVWGIMIMGYPANDDMKIGGGGGVLVAGT